MATLRVGLGLGLGQVWRTREEFASLVRATEETGWDSLWFSEHLTSATPAQFPQLAFAAALTSRIQLGTSVTVVPGRSPVDLAKNLATLNALAGGRLLPILGLGTAEPAEHAAFGVSRESRGPWMDEALPLLRDLTRGMTVHHETGLLRLPGVSIGMPDPLPIRSLWMGGRSPRELERVGRLADGWLASFSTPDETADGLARVRRAAAEAGRAIDDDHYGLLFPYAHAQHSPTMERLLATFHPDREHALMAPVGPRQLTDTLRHHAAAGLTKFVLVPTEPRSDWHQALCLLRDDVDQALAGC